MMKFAEWLQARHPNYLLESDFMGRRAFLGTAATGVAGMMGLGGMALAAGPRRPVAKVEDIDPAEPNTVGVAIEFKASGNQVEDKRTAVRVLTDNGRTALGRKIQAFTKGRQDVFYDFQLVDPANQKIITIVSIGKYMKYPDGNKEGETCKVEADYRIVWYDSNRNVIPNIVQWMKMNKPMPAARGGVGGGGMAGGGGFGGRPLSQPPEVKPPR